MPVTKVKAVNWSPWSAQVSLGSQSWHSQTVACHSQITARQNITGTASVNSVGFLTRLCVFQHMAEAWWALKVPHRLLAGLCFGRLVGEHHFDGLSCISAYLCVSSQGCIQRADTAFLEQRHPSCAPSHALSIKLVRVDICPKVFPAVVNISIFRSSPTSNWKKK